MKLLFLYYILAYPWLAYGLLFFGMMVEGDLLLFAAAFLVELGFLNGWIALPLMFAGAIIGDVMFFEIGRRYLTRYAWLMRWSERVGAFFDQRLLSRLGATILISKFLYYVHRPIQLRAGMLRIPLRQFFITDLWSTVIWFATVTLFAYLSGTALSFLSRELRFVEAALGIGFIAFFVFEYLLRRRLSRKGEKR